MKTPLIILALCYGGGAILGVTPKVPNIFMANAILAGVWLWSTYDGLGRPRPSMRAAAWLNVVLSTLSVLILPLDWSQPSTGIWAFTMMTVIAFAAGFAARDERKL
jgi:hypothetical protein